MSLFFLQLRGELLKMFARKRTHIGFGAFVVLELLVLGLLQLPRVQGSFRRLIEGSGYAFETYFSGLTLAFFIVQWTVFLLGGLYLALVGGDVVSKEVEDGTLRMVLCRPISRSRLLALKWICCLVYAFVLTGFIGVTALAAGLLYGGVGGLFVFSPLEGLFALYDFQEGLARYAGGIVLLAVSLSAVISLAFLFSCFPMKPAAATIVTLSVVFVDSILRQVPYFESLRPWFLTSHMAAWIEILRDPIPWSAIVESYAILGAFAATAYLVGRIVFEVRDFKA